MGTVPGISQNSRPMEVRTAIPDAERSWPLLSTDFVHLETWTGGPTYRAELARNARGVGGAAGAGDTTARD